MSSQPNVLVAPVDPYHETWGLLVPAISQRILAFARENFNELDPLAFTRTIMARLWAQDPYLMVLALIETEPLKLVGHVVASIEGDGTNRWCYVSQCKADGNVGDAVKRAIVLGDQWARQHKVGKMVMSTPRSDAAWKKRYQFETMRHTMIRDVGSSIEGVEE